jgi:hypothetical protein
MAIGASLTRERVVFEGKNGDVSALTLNSPKKAVMRLNAPLLKAIKPADVMQSLLVGNNLHFIYKTNG